MTAQSLIRASNARLVLISLADFGECVAELDAPPSIPYQRYHRLTQMGPVCHVQGDPP